MRKKRTKFYLSAAIATLSPLFAGTALAQSDGEQDASRSGLQEIVVTAQKRSESLQDVPVAVSAVSSEMIKNLSFSTGADLQKMTPNLIINSGSNFFAPYLRGIGTQYANFGLDSSVATYLDDQFISRPQAGLSSLNDVERIEVLKGPQGTLYGRNATGGAIRIITKDPTYDLEGSAALTYGRFDRIMGEAVLNLPLSDTLAIRIAGLHDRRDGFVKVDVPDHKNVHNRNMTVIRGKLLWEPTDQLRVKLTGDYWHKDDRSGLAFINVDPSGPTQVGVVLGGTPSSGFYRSTNDGHPRSNVKTASGQLRIDYDLPTVTLSSITTYRWSKNLNYESDLDTVDIPFLHDDYFENSRSWSQEVQAVSSGDGPFKYTVGAYYFRETGGNLFSIYGSSINAQFGVPDGPNVGRRGGGAELVAISDGKVESFAPYAELTYDVSEKFSVTVGARYTWETKSLLDNRVSGVGVIPGVDIPIAQFSQKTKFRQFTPKLSLVYKPDSDILLYATYSRGFKSGGINTPAFAETPPVDPEILDSYEFGWKTEFGNVRFNGSAFYYDYKDLQVQRTDQTTGGTRVENAANAKIFGIEGELTIAASDRLELGFGGGYLHSEFKGYLGDAYVPAFQTPACAAGGGAACLGYATIPNVNFSGQTLPQAPKFSGFARLQYEQPLSFGSLLFAALASYSSKFFYNPEQSLSERARTLVNASITWRSQDERFSVGVFGENIFDRKYNLVKVRQGSGGWRIPGDPAMWGVRVGYNF